MGDDPLNKELETLRVVLQSLDYSRRKGVATSQTDPFQQCNLEQIRLGNCQLLSVDSSQASELFPVKELANACKPKSTSTADAGYIDSYRGWYDVQGCGQCLDYCRWVGNSGPGGDPSNKLDHGASWWSCRLAGSSSAYSGRGHFATWPYSKCNGEGAVAPHRRLEEVTQELSVEPGSATEAVSEAIIL